MSQPALSQTVGGLERQLGVSLLVRGSTGVHATEAGTALLGEARAVLARHDQALRVMAGYAGPGGGALRIGIPLGCPPGCSIPRWRSWPWRTRTRGCRPAPVHGGTAGRAAGR
ncbi:LysR family transcriptional regulator [Streptomyces diastatochromogenes]|nr:LysR family transcriptional regulator [Streptomyces diastatochromogenes]